jgi:capsular exopolysaccharide synthesis family protein
MFDLSHYLYIVKQRYWVFLASFITVVLTTAVYTMYQVPVYRATTTIIIEPDVPKVIDFDGAMEVPRLNTYYNTQYEIIKSNSVLKKTIGLLEPRYKSDLLKSKDPVEAFKKRIEVRPIKNSQLVEISVLNVDPTRAAEQVNALARAYIQHNLEDRRAASRDAFTWLSEQLSVLKSRVEQSELALLKFMEQEHIVSLDKRQVLLEENLSALQQRYLSALSQHSELETTLQEINKLKADTDTPVALPRRLESKLFERLNAERNDLVMELAEASRKYKAKHPAIIALRSKISEIEDLINSEVERIANSIEVEYQISKSNLEAIKKSLEMQKKESMLLAKQAIQYSVLEREAQTNKQMYGVLLQRLKQTDISESITANNIRVVDKAKVPDRVRSQLSANITRAAIAGFILGVFLCFVFDYLDNTFKSGDDVEQYLKEPLLGIVPKEKVDDALSPEGENLLARYYRDIKTTIGFYRKEHLLKTLLVTSSIRNEGKTTSVVLLAKAFAQTEGKILLVDSDIFKPRLGKLFNIKNDKGLVSYINGDDDIKDIIYETDVPNLSVIPAGLIPPNPVGVLGSDKMKDLIESVKQEFDFVIVDAPPLSAALEVSVLGSVMDGIGVVIKAGSTSRVLVRKLFEGLENAKCNVLGVILTSVTRISGDMSAYYYYKYYGKYYGRNT